MARFPGIFLAACCICLALAATGHCGSIAAILTSDLPQYREAHRAFVRALERKGYGQPGTDVLLQVPNPDQLSWSNTVRKLNAYRPAFIVAYGTPAAVTAMRESEGIPVISVDYYGEPVAGSMGVSSRTPLLTLLKTMQGIRSVRKLGVIYTAREAGSLRQLEDLRRLARQNGISLVEGNVNSMSGVESAVNGMLDRVDSLFVTESTIACRSFDRIIARTQAKSLPVLSTMPDSAERGALVSLEINPQEQGSMAAEIAAKLLSGAHPGQLQLQSPKRVDLVINLAAAKEMGISVPFQVLSLATRIIK